MNTFTELLPPTKSEPHAALDWTPSEDAPGKGVLLIKTTRLYCEYVVEEVETQWRGRVFRLTKLTAGSDPTEPGYHCFLAANVPERLCECRGFNFTGDCKHLAALQTLFDNSRL